MTPLVVSIGTTHPRNVAGVGRDARVAAQYGIAHAMAIAAISAQDERGVHALFPAAPHVLRSQLAAIDFAGAAVRIGALGNAENAAMVGEFLRDHAGAVVFDPVMRASAGGALYAGEPLDAVRSVLGNTPVIVTPNIDEAQRLTAARIASVDDMIAAGARLVRDGARAALVKGGHLAGDPVDVLVTSEGVQTFTGSRLPQTMRGTGCTLAMALACELALGRTLSESVKGARAYVRENIASRMRAFDAPHRTCDEVTAADHPDFGDQG